jgi:hypothetical protein
VSHGWQCWGPWLDVGFAFELLELNGFRGVELPFLLFELSESEPSNSSDGLKRLALGLLNGPASVPF